MVVGDVGLSLLQPKGLQLWMLSRLWIKVLEQLFNRKNKPFKLIFHGPKWLSKLVLLLVGGVILN